jgi:hypothetical protein
MMSRFQTPLSNFAYKFDFCRYTTVTGAVVQVNYGKRCLECVYQLHDGRARPNMLFFLPKFPMLNCPNSA